MWELFSRDKATFVPAGRMCPDATMPASIACMRGDVLEYFEVLIGYGAVDGGGGRPGRTITFMCT